MYFIESFYYFYFILTLVLIFAFTVDDLFLDLLHFLLRVKPEKLSKNFLKDMDQMSEKNIAILMANWHEDQVLRQMITGNINHIQYHNYHFFLGVYPNDQKTWKVARDLEARFENVHVIVNSLEGPTSKGQLLNEMVRHLNTSEIRSYYRWDAIMLHDAEDIIHPLSLKLINYKLENADFIQTPVYSLPVPKSHLTAGTYIDEFAESHTKDLLVRNHLKLSIPSAGVGTAVKWAFVKKLLDVNEGNLLSYDSLTEDYFLGLQVYQLGGRPEFVNATYEKNGKIEQIATREYFPSSVWTSIKQKTRWTTGICFQAAKEIPFFGSMMNRYFQWRDRRGFWNALVVLMSLVNFIALGVAWLVYDKSPSYLFSNKFLEFLLVFNLAAMLIRVFQRMRFVYTVYGCSQACMVPVRWLLSSWINTIAALRAFKVYYQAERNGVRPAWSKTDHVILENFGLEVEEAVPAKMPMAPVNASIKEVVGSAN